MSSLVAAPGIVRMPRIADLFLDLEPANHELVQIPDLAGDRRKSDHQFWSCFADVRAACAQRSGSAQGTGP